MNSTTSEAWSFMQLEWRHLARSHMSLRRSSRDAKEIHMMKMVNNTTFTWYTAYGTPKEIGDSSTPAWV